MWIHNICLRAEIGNTNLVSFLPGKFRIQKNAIVEEFNTTREAIPGVTGNRGIVTFISGEQGNTRLKNEGTGKQM